MTPDDEQAPLVYLLALDGGGAGTAGLEYAAVKIDKAQLEKWQKLLRSAQETKEKHEGLMSLRLQLTNIWVGEPLPDDQPLAGRLTQGAIEELDVRRQVPIPAEMLERTTERVPRIGLSLLEVGPGRVSWTITPKHTDLELGVSTLYQEELNRIETRLQLYDLQDLQNQQQQIEQICRKDPQLGMSLLEEWNWLQQLELKRQRWNGIQASHFSALLNHEEQQVRKKAIRLTGGKAQQKRSGGRER